MRSTRLVLVRHAESDTGGALCGWTDVPLTTLGERQARALGRRELELDAVYSSPLRRARDTASHTARLIRYDPDLREIWCGRLEGIPLAALRRDHVALWASNEAQGDDDFRWPGGESYRELRARSIAVVSALAALHEGRRIALVTHSGVISQILGYLLGAPAARWSRFRVGNASTTEIDWRSSRGIVRTFDVRDHLVPELRT